jgi:hypothetical protein
MLSWAGASMAFVLCFGAALPSRAERPEPEPEVQAYGLQIFAVDFLFVGFTAVGTVSSFKRGQYPPPALWVVDGLVYLLGGPTVHFLHHRRARALGSAALRLSPAVLAGVAYLAGNEKYYGPVNLATAGVIFFGVFGTMAAMIIDWTVLGHDAPPKPSGQQPVALVVSGNGLALRGRF